MKFMFRSTAFVPGTVVALLGVLLLGACSSPRTPSTPPPDSTVSSDPIAIDTEVPVSKAPEYLASSTDRLLPGNKITVTYSGNPSAPPRHEEKIREDGKITPPLLREPVVAAGRTIGELQEELHQLYVPNYFKTLTVTVNTEERFVYVGGDVRNPGPKPWLPGMTVVRAIRAAGDFSEYGNPRNVLVTRANGEQLEINCSRALKNPDRDKPVYPEDQIYVRRRVVF